MSVGRNITSTEFLKSTCLSDGTQVTISFSDVVLCLGCNDRNLCGNRMCFVVLRFRAISVAFCLESCRYGCLSRLTFCHFDWRRERVTVVNLLWNRWWELSLVMRKPVFARCEQQRRRSACASAQSDQRLCFRCLGSIIPLLAIAEISRL